MRGSLSDDLDMFMARQRLRLRKQWIVGFGRIERARQVSKQDVSDAWTVRGRVSGYSGTICPDQDGMLIRHRRRG